MPVILAALARGPLGRRIHVRDGCVESYTLDEILECLTELCADGIIISFNADDAWVTGNGTISLGV